MMEDPGWDVDGASSYRGLGKRSFREFQRDNIPEPPPPPISNAAFQPPVEPKAMQLYRTLVVYVSTLAGHSSSWATRAWDWLLGTHPSPRAAPINIMSVESETGNKRRALVRDDADDPSTISPPPPPPPASMAHDSGSPPKSQSRSWRIGQTSTSADDSSDEEEHHRMSGAIPSAKSQKQDLPSPPTSQDDEPHESDTMRTSVAAPGAFPDMSKGPTPPQSRPTSAHEQKQHLQASPRAHHPQTRTTARPSTAKSPLPQASSQPPRPTSLAANVRPEHGMSLSRFRADLERNQDAKKPAPTSPASFRRSNAKLPRQARDAIRQQRDEAADARQKKQERQNQRDVDIDNLISRAKTVSIESPEVRSFRNEFRRSKQLRQSQIEEEQRIEREKIEREDAEARAQAELEEEAQRLADLKAEEERRRRERLVPDLSEEWEDRVANALATDNAKVLAKSVEGVELTKYDLERLYNHRGSTWLNDETVNAWFAALVKKKNEQAGRVYKRGSATVPHSAAYNTMWFSNYKSNGITAIKNWSLRKGIQGAALLKAEKIYFPINAGAHWTLLIVSPTSRTIEYLDSLGGKNGYAFTAARDWVAMELGGAFQPAEWKEVDGMSQPQKNGDDCGVFACINGFASVKGVAFGRVESVKGMMDARRWMVAVLLNGGFEGEFEL